VNSIGSSPRIAPMSETRHAADVIDGPRAPVQHRKHLGAVGRAHPATQAGRRVEPLGHEGVELREYPHWFGQPAQERFVQDSQREHV